MGHSFGGMLLLSEAQIQMNAKALILMSTVPHTIFMENGGSYLDHPDFQKKLSYYKKSPSDEALRQMVVALSPFYFEEKEMTQGKAMLTNMGYSHLAYDHLFSTFLQTYSASYIPDIPCMILSGDADVVTPLTYFQDDARFKKKNIAISSIKQSNHFPWINNPKETYRALNDFLNDLSL